MIPTNEELDDLCKEIAEETLDDYDELEELELQKQAESMQYADQAADLDAEFYGANQYRKRLTTPCLSDIMVSQT